MKKQSLSRILAATGGSAIFGAVALTGWMAVAEPPAIQNRPQSVFVIPVSKQDGRDPFYPNSTRIGTQPVTVPVVLPANVELKGISGSADRRLALINNQTLAEGETAEVKTSQGRAEVKCKKIEGLTVTVEVDGVPRVLTLPAGI